MACRKGISWGTQPDGRALPVSPRYFARVQTPQFLGGLSYFHSIFEPLAEGFIDGLLTVYGPRPGHRAPACPGHLPTPCTRESSLPCTPALVRGVNSTDSNPMPR